MCVEAAARRAKQLANIKKITDDEDQLTAQLVPDINQKPQDKPSGLIQ
jgi:hypothetical protein